MKLLKTSRAGRMSIFFLINESKSNLNLHICLMISYYIIAKLTFVVLDSCKTNQFKDVTLGFKKL